MATCAELSGQKTPTSASDSYSFLSAINKEQSKEALRTSLVHHSINGTFAVRKGEWKLIDAKGSGGWSLYENQFEGMPNQQLYNLKKDVAEKNNLLDQHPEIAKELNAMLDEFKSGNEAR
ncbi:MAG: hypothetical protein N4A71_17215 [Carboxylicivirga sp.]|nr:hypothetical protein [Carboxylicivirga sp.]